MGRELVKVLEEVLGRCRPPPLALGHCFCSYEMSPEKTLGLPSGLCFPTSSLDSSVKRLSPLRLPVRFLFDEVTHTLLSELHSTLSLM